MVWGLFSIGDISIYWQLASIFSIASASFMVSKLDTTLLSLMYEARVALDKNEASVPKTEVGLGIVVITYWEVKINSLIGDYVGSNLSIRWQVKY